jgi:hypothetical protein
MVAALQNFCGVRGVTGIYLKMIYAIVPPENAQQVLPPRQAGPAPGPRLTEDEERLMAVLGRSERQTATVWTVVNTTVRELAPRSRSETRRLRITLLQALNQLLRRGLVRRHQRDFVRLGEGAVHGLRRPDADDQP